MAFSEWKFWNKILFLKQIFLIPSTMNSRSQNSVISKVHIHIILMIFFFYITLLIILLFKSHLLHSPQGPLLVHCAPWIGLVKIYKLFKEIFISAEVFILFYNMFFFEQLTSLLPESTINSIVYNNYCTSTSKRERHDYICTTFLVKWT